MRGAYVMNLGVVPYQEAWDLQRSLAGAFDALAPRLVVAIHGACLGAGIELPAFAGRVIAAGRGVRDLVGA